MAQRKYGLDMDFLSMVPPNVDIQQGMVPPGSQYIELVERMMEPVRGGGDVIQPVNAATHCSRVRRLKLRVCSLGPSWAMDRRYSISFAYDAITHKMYVAAVYLNGSLIQGAPPICDDREYRELCALYLEEELKDRLETACQVAVWDFMVEVHVEKYLRRPLAGQ